MSRVFRTALFAVVQANYQTTLCYSHEIAPPFEDQVQFVVIIEFKKIETKPLKSLNAHLVSFSFTEMGIDHAIPTPRRMKMFIPVPKCSTWKGQPSWWCFPADTPHSLTVVPMLVQCLRRWPNIETALSECLLFAWPLWFMIPFPPWIIFQICNMENKYNTTVYSDSAIMSNWVSRVTKPLISHTFWPTFRCMQHQQTFDQLWIQKGDQGGTDPFFQN